MSAAHPKPTPTHAHPHVTPKPLPTHHTVATTTTPSDTLSVFGVGVSQGKLIFVFLVVGILLMMLRRYLTQSRRYVPSNPPKDYSSAEA